MLLPLSKLAASTFLQVLPEAFQPETHLPRTVKSGWPFHCNFVLNDHIDHNTSGCHNLKDRSGGKVCPAIH